MKKDKEKVEELVDEQAEERARLKAELRAELKSEILAELEASRTQGTDHNGGDGKTPLPRSGDASLKLINLLFDPEDKNLPMITRVERRAVLPLSIQIMRESITDPKRIEDGTPLSEIWRIAYFKLQRSVDMRGFMIAAGLAHEQAQAETEELEEEEL